MSHDSDRFQSAANVTRFERRLWMGSRTIDHSRLRDSEFLIDMSLSDSEFLIDM